MRVSVERMRAQISAPSLSRRPLNVGDEVIINSIIENDIQLQGGVQANDSLICTINKREMVRITLREYLKMVDIDNQGLYQVEEGSDRAALPEGFVVVKATPRMVNGEKVYPLGAYNDADKFFSAEITVEELYQSGVDKCRGFQPKNDYVIRIK